MEGLSHIWYDDHPGFPTQLAAQLFDGMHVGLQKEALIVHTDATTGALLQNILQLLIHVVVGTIAQFLVDFGR
jgi:hypothetical protein